MGKRRRSVTSGKVVTGKPGKPGISVILRGRKWVLRYVNWLKDASGDCSRPEQKEYEIRICRKYVGVHELDTIIHECLHATSCVLSEEYVESAATEIANVLWKLGYRRGK